MLTITILSFLSILPSVLFALRCHQVATGNLANPPTTQPTECMAGSLSCVKIVDYTTKTFTKQCQQMNCTAGTLMNAPAQCMNTSQLGRESLNCCCYGDGCNSAPMNTIWLAISAITVPFIVKGIFV